MTHQIIEQRNGIGLIIFEAKAKMDYDQSFCTWHDDLKGNISKYCQLGKQMLRKSRLRKSKIIFEKIIIVFFQSINDITNGLDIWIKKWSQGKNADGKMRNPKYIINIEKIPQKYIMTQYNYNSPNFNKY